MIKIGMEDPVTGQRSEIGSIGWAIVMAIIPCAFVLGVTISALVCLMIFAWAVVEVGAGLIGLARRAWRSFQRSCTGGEN